MITYYRINKEKTKTIHAGRSGSPNEALEWAKEKNKELTGDSDPQCCCHCGLLDVGTDTPDGPVKEVYHITEHLVVILT